MSIDSTVPVYPRRINAVITWILRLLVALVFGGAGIAKLAGAAMLIAEFDQIGIGQWFRYTTGVVEIAGAVLVLWPLSTFYGSLLLLCVCIGAFTAQIGPLHGDLIHVVVLTILVATTAWFTRPTSGVKK